MHFFKLATSLTFLIGLSAVLADVASDAANDNAGGSTDSGYGGNAAAAKDAVVGGNTEARSKPNSGANFNAGAMGMPPNKNGDSKAGASGNGGEHRDLPSKKGPGGPMANGFSGHGGNGRPDHGNWKSKSKSKWRGHPHGKPSS